MTAIAEPEIQPAETPQETRSDPGGSAMIVFEDVRKVYEPGVVALEKVSFTIDKGEFVFVVGASGSGKSSLALAGVRPKVRESYPDWIYPADFTPESAPLDALAGAVCAAVASRKRRKNSRELSAVIQRPRRYR